MYINENHVYIHVYMFIWIYALLGPVDPCYIYIYTKRLGLPSVGLHV